MLIISYFAARIYIIGLAILYQEHFREFIVLGRGSPFTWEAGGKYPLPPPPPLSVALRLDVLQWLKSWEGAVVLDLFLEHGRTYIQCLSKRNLKQEITLT